VQEQAERVAGGIAHDPQVGPFLRLGQRPPPSDSASFTASARAAWPSSSALAEAMQLRALGGRLDAALADAQAAVAGLATAQAIQTCRTAWSADLVLLSLALADTGGDLAHAATDYARTEHHNAAEFETIHARLEPPPTPPAGRP
jgi:hypothetical protein